MAEFLIKKVEDGVRICAKYNLTQLGRTLAENMKSVNNAYVVKNNGKYEEWLDKIQNLEEKKAFKLILNNNENFGQLDWKRRILANMLFSNTKENQILEMFPNHKS